MTRMGRLMLVLPHRRGQKQAPVRSHRARFVTPLRRDTHQTPGCIQAQRGERGEFGDF